MSEDGLCGPASAEDRRAALRNARMSRRWTPAREAVFFAELAETANIRHAAERAGMTAASAHKRRQGNAAFGAQWMVALEAGYARLEMVLLDQSLNGFDTVETVRDAEGAVKQVKTVRSFPHGVAMRLLQGHREAVERYRAMEAMRTDRDPDMTIRIRAEIARVRSRLLGDADEEAHPGVLIEAGRVDG